MLFAALRQLRHLRRYVTDDCFRSLVVSLIHSRVETQLWKLRPGRTADCQLIYSNSSSLSSTLRLVWCFGLAAMTTSPTLSQFFIGCVRVPQRVDFKIAVMAFRVLHGLASPYLDQLVRVADLPGRRTRAYVHQRHTS